MPMVWAERPGWRSMSTALVFFFTGRLLGNGAMRLCWAFGGSRPGREGLYGGEPWQEARVTTRADHAGSAVRRRLVAAAPLLGSPQFSHERCIRYPPPRCAG